jgi:ketosteroid isomerase-like protein
MSVLFVLVAVLGVHAAQPTDEAAILAIEKAWIDGFKTKDKAFYEKNLVDDFTYVNERGELVKGRAAYVQTVMDFPADAEIHDTNESIRVIGSTGIAIGHFVAKFKDGTQLETRYTDSFAKGPDGWKAIASHETIVGK